MSISNSIRAQIPPIHPEGYPSIGAFAFASLILFWVWSPLGWIGSVLTLFGIFIFRRFMAERSIAYVVGFLVVTGLVLSAPTVGMYYGLHQWTAALTDGAVGARTIMLVNTTLAAPLGQVAMIPMLAWIARSAPAKDDCYGNCLRKISCCLSAEPWVVWLWRSARCSWFGRPGCTLFP